MRLTEEQITKFIAIIKKLYGIELTYEEAVINGNGVIQLFETMLNIPSNSAAQ